jgi:NADPH-dependent 2,4-dienoyl-CoA reductase/sulfur reductase-like enzyme/rhodanese-related sulfurtransferase
MRIVIVGGVAGGMSAAARARRLDEHAEIIVFDKGPDVSFANCGLPYHVSGDIASRDALLLHTPASLRSTLNLDVRVRTEVTAIDRRSRTVTAVGPDGEYELSYDALVLAPGATATVPPIPGIDLPQVTNLRTVDDATTVAERVENARRAVVMGAGFIGLETAEALRTRGLDVTVVELASQVLPPLAPELAHLVEAELLANGVNVRTGVAASAITADGADAVLVSLSDGATVAADIVVVSVGVRPNSALAKAAGLALDERGAIIVDSEQRTSDPHIWAVGDATAVPHAVTGATAPVPLAGPANRQGRRAAESIHGVATSAKPVLGTAIVRVFGLTAALTGASPRMLDAAGIAYVQHHTHHANHAGYYPGAQQMHLLATFSPDGTLLGAQGVGRAGVDKRIDVLATALRAGFGADDLAELELAYSPPYGAAKDPVNMLGFIMQNEVAGTLTTWGFADVEWARANALILDVRSRAEFAQGHVPEAINVPHTEVRARLDEIRTAAAGRPVRVHCASGFRSYLAHRILAQSGIDSANFDGGMLTMAAALPDLPLIRESAPH